jgi:hypothetical protein
MRVQRRTQKVVGCAISILAFGTAISLSTDVIGKAAFTAPDIDPVLLTSFGERPAFSPDGTRIAFIGKTYGDAYEIDLRTRAIRNITSDVPHQGIVRIQYLPNGDYLVTAPQHFLGPSTRAQLQLWVLKRDLTGGLQPLREHPMEGVAVSKTKNLIAWTAFDPPITLKPGVNWKEAFGRPTKRYVAEIVYDQGIPHIAGKREIISTLPERCGFAEPQDFRDNDQELVFSCSSTDSGPLLISTMGYNMRSNTLITYRSKPGEYNEAEGIAPDGTWTTVECGIQGELRASPPLDICKLELRLGGQFSKLVIGTRPGTTEKISNPVVSPDGKWVAYQRGDTAVGDEGEGMGIYLKKIG